MQYGAGVVCHSPLEGDNHHLIGSDGVHLNEIGLDVFLSGLQEDGQAMFLLGCGGGSGSGM